MANSAQGFLPEWVSPPGDTIADALEERGLPPAQLAERIGETSQFVFQLLRGEVPITLGLAHKLEAVLGGSAAFWMIRESQYRDDVIRGTRNSELLGWLGEVPVNDMVKFGWLPSDPRLTKDVRSFLRFFDVEDLSEWHTRYKAVRETAAYRTSRAFESKPGAVAAWLRQGEIESGALNCKSWSPRRFAEVLHELRALTRIRHPSHFIPELQKRCAQCGVAVLVIRAPTGCRASGATRFLQETRALLLLSFRYLSDDQFWFTFFHEAGHLLLHGKDALFLEGSATELSPEEREANDFAAQILIPPEFQERLLALEPNAREVIRFARIVGIAPGIVVGQLQYLGRIRPNQLNSLKRRFSWI